MTNSFYYIADGKAYLHREGKELALRSVVLESYIERVKESAKRNEWKYSGTGAAFTNTYQSGADAESRVSSVFSKITCLKPLGDELLYALTIDRTNGIYRKTKENLNIDGIVISSADNAYYDFDVKDGRLAVASSFAGESHIGVMDMESGDLNIYTEGNSWDHSPAWSAFDRNKIYFCCAGLPIKSAKEPSREGPKSYNDIVEEMYAAASVSERGASSICLLDTKEGTLDELLSDPNYDHTHPQSVSDGSLYYIRKPHVSNSKKSTPFGCLLDIVLLPARLLRAIFGFLNVFSAKYSGKTLSKNKDVKNRDEETIFIDGNLINAEKELKANKKRGEKTPGIIPHSWELRRLDQNGKDTLVRSGVAAFFVNETDGIILVSNGSGVLCIHPDGKEEKICSVSKITKIYCE